jgi:putative membrane protein
VGGMTKLSTALLITLSVAATANAQTNGTQPPKQIVQPTVVSAMTDSDFIMKAHEGGVRELAAGKMGVEKANHADVKAFAQRMVTDHGKANEELMTLAKAKNVSLNKAGTTPTPAPPAAPTALNTLAGTAFDRAYMDQMVKDHEATVLLFEAQARDGKDAEVKAWAAKKLPTLKAHLKDAQNLQARIGR